jgi:hypothetical protein
MGSLIPFGSSNICPIEEFSAWSFYYQNYLVNRITVLRQLLCQMQTVALIWSVTDD